MERAAPVRESVDIEPSEAKWEHPGGKLIEAGPRLLSNEELVAILIGTGCGGRSAEQIAHDVMYEFYSFYGLLGKRPEDLTKIKGLKQGKIARICAAYEITKRIIKEQGWEIPAVRKITLELPDHSDAELLAVLIGTGYKDKSPLDLANELLKMVSSLSGIMGRRLYDMARITGLGDAKVIRIAAAYEIMSRVVKILENE